MNRSKPDDARDAFLDRLRLDQARRWASGQRPQVEDYAREHPEVAADVELLLDLVYSEMLVREEHGETLDVEEFAARFPAHADSLRRLWDVHRALPSSAELAGDATLASHAPPPSFGDGGAHGTPTPNDAAPRIPGYEIAGEVGRGGMGVVYRARHVPLDRPVALKLLRGEAAPGAEQRERFAREAQAVARLQHPQIVQIFDSGEWDGRPFLAFEWVAGETLVAWTRPPLRSPRQCAALAALLARGVAHAHSQGIVHRDLKPANILLAPRPTEGGSSSLSGTAAPGARGDTLDCVPKITDFGLAKRLADDVELTHSAALLGTGAYMSPEQAWGRARDVGPTTDVHALGLVLYEILTGRNPYRDDSLVATLDRVRFTTAPPPSELRPDVPAALDAICARCLAKEPTERYESAERLADDLERFLADAPLASPPPRRGAHPPRRPLRSALRAAVALVAIVGAAAGWRAVARSRGTSGRPALDHSATNVSPAESSLGAPVPRTRGERFAFLVGVRSYRLDGQTLDLEYTEADVDELSRVLLKQGVPRRNIRLLTQWSEADNPQLAPTAANIRRQLKTLLDECIPQDDVLVAITGMGGETGENGTYCYLPADARLDDPSSILPLSEFFALFRDSPAGRKLLLVDTCQTAAIRDLSISASPAPPGAAALFACSSHEASYEHATLRHGVFSYHVLRGLEGAADADGDRRVTLAELHDFSRRGVREFLARELPDAVQTPRLVAAPDADPSRWILAPFEPPGS